MINIKLKVILEWTDGEVTAEIETTCLEQFAVLHAIHFFRICSKLKIEDDDDDDDDVAV